MGPSRSIAQQSIRALSGWSASFHDDDGRLHLSRPTTDADGDAARVARFERLLRESTWFAEGMAGRNFHNPGTFGEGVTELYGIDAFIWELNARWAEGLGRQPMHTDWREMGAEFAEVMRRQFGEGG